MDEPLSPGGGAIHAMRGARRTLDEKIGKTMQLPAVFSAVKAFLAVPEAASMASNGEIPLGAASISSRVAGTRRKAWAGRIEAAADRALPAARAIDGNRVARVAGSTPPRAPTLVGGTKRERPA